MKKINTFLITVVLVMICLFSVGCTSEGVDMLIADTQQLVSSAQSFNAVEKVMVKDLNIANILTVQNMDINIERKVGSDSTRLSVMTANTEIKINDDVGSIIQGMLDLLGLTGKLTVANLESAFSRISLDLKAEITDKGVSGKVIINNVKNMFKPTQREALEVEFNSAEHGGEEWYQNMRRLTSSHLMGEFRPSEDNIKPNKKYPFIYDNTSLTGVLDGVVALFGTDKLGSSDMSVKDIMADSLGKDSFKQLFDEYVKLENMSGMVALDSMDGKKYVKNMTVQSNLAVTIGKAQMDKLIDNIAAVSDNQKIKEFYTLISMVADYNNILEGKLDMVFEYTLTK